MHIQSEDARDFYAKSMAHLNAYVGADINKVLPEALERHIKCLESMRVSPIYTLDLRSLIEQWEE